MKTKVNKIFYTGLFTVCSLAANAQTTTDYLRAAERFFKEGDYYSASQYYEKFLTGKPGKSTSSYSPYVVQKASKITSGGAATPSSRKDVVYNLAESYRMVNYYSKAAPYYQEAATMGSVNPLAPYWHAKCERAMGNLDSAEMEFRAFQASYTTQDEVSKDVQKELDNLAFVKSQKTRRDLGRYAVAKSSAPVNQSGASYAPFYMADGALTFTSTRPDTTTGQMAGKNPYTNKVYQAASNSTIASDLQKLNLPADSKMEQGVAAFTPDGNKMFLTKWEMKDRKKVSALYSSTKNADGWSTPSKLPVTINADGANTQQPFVTADGRYLLFSSDRSGGQGKFDIWYVQLSSSFEPSAEVMNLGTTINTAGDDEAAFYHQPSQTIVVASNGRTGMGGYDLYYSKGTFGGNWEMPVNMGQPVNSVKDDIYYATSDKTSIWNNALLSSDRDSPCCLEMYSFDRKSLPKVITGTVVDCNSNAVLSGASVSITDASGKTIATKTTDADGKYSLTMAEAQALKVSASNSGYTNGTAMVAPAMADMDSTTAQVICLTLINKPNQPDMPTGDNWVFDNALFNFDKANLTDESKAVLDRVVDRLNQNPKMTLQIESHTDNFGSDEYNMALSEKRAQACADYLVEKGIDSGRLTTKGLGESQPVAPNTINGKDNPEGRAKNRRTEFKVVTK